MTQKIEKGDMVAFCERGDDSYSRGTYEVVELPSETGGYWTLQSEVQTLVYPVADILLVRREPNADRPTEHVEVSSDS